ncbi:MAG: EAL domain-containing protein [Desulfuromonas sp.]|nr:EAL domain-containing protein [Desulfuromonas sp.]
MTNEVKFSSTNQIELPRHKLADSGGKVGKTSRHFFTRQGRTQLIVKARWQLLGIISLYCLAAGLSFLNSSYGFFLSSAQMAFLFIALLCVSGYNLIFHLFYPRLQTIPYIDHIHILLDILVITGLIHFSGGVASWFWPVYMIITIEASVLLEKRLDVWVIGVLGGLCYGAVLLAEYYHLLSTVQMPFTVVASHSDPLFLFMMWLWVSFLNGTVAIISTFLMKIIRRESSEAIASEERLTSFLESANDLIFSFTPQGEVLYANQAWRTATGYDPQQESVTIDQLLDDENLKQCQTKFAKLLDGEAVEPSEVMFQAKQGNIVQVEGSITCGGQLTQQPVLWGICRDITERKQAEECLRHMAHHDMLTGLPNRVCFMERVEQAKLMSKRTQNQLAFLFLDLDRFKIINDTLGHAVGDQLLCTMGKRLRSAVREEDVVGRIGGDEFVVMLVNVDGVSIVEKIAEKIIKVLAEPLFIDGHELYITSSMGVTMFPKDGAKPEDLLKRADIAMYCAKAQGRNGFQFYQSSMDQEAGKRLIMENGLRKALEYDEFELYYQPKVNIASGEVTAVEALIRWHHSELGLVLPGEFISLAEETGLILPIGEWVLRRACEQSKAWQKEGLPPVRVAVNLSGHQLQQRDLVKQVMKILDETGVDPVLLELEVTETVIMQNPEYAVNVLNQLREQGVHISIDDFGTGYSSLAHLKRFSVNTLKIDKSFIRDIEKNDKDAAIATAIIDMGNSLDLNVIAEGVETLGQLAFLKSKDCDEIQGYLFSAPVPDKAIRELLENGKNL